jgi:cytochrome c556
MKSLFVIVLIFTHVFVASAWDPFGIFKSAKAKFDDASKKLTGNAKTAAIQVENHLFNDLLPPLIQKVSALANGLVSDVNADVQQTVDHVKAGISQIIDQTVTH